MNRRQMIAGAASLLGAGLVSRAGAQPSTAIEELAQSSLPSADALPYTPVITPNGRTLPWRMRDGVKEFHLIAEQVEHEFAPGTKIKAWGYNGSTPGPTIEAVEGDFVRIYVTNRLLEPTTIHWHGLILPFGMDGVAGLTQRAIDPGETWVYEFELKQHGTHMYHPHSDEMVQMAMGMMGMFIIHPRAGNNPPVDRDYALLLHNWAVRPGTYRPDPSVMVDFDLWTMNSKVFPAIAPLMARTGERVRVRIGNLSMWNHPMHMHGVQFDVTGSDGGRWPREQWRKEVTELVGVGQTRDLEFVAVAGDWPLHCHMAHHTMNAMGHDITNTIGVNQREVARRIRQLVPGYMPMGEHGMSEHQMHIDMGHMQGPENTLPMMGGMGPFGSMEMGGMFTLIKVRDQGEDLDPAGWFSIPEGTQARRVEGPPDDLPT
ncbi:copper oxidase [Pseudohongiella sp. SYSU M77423]|uniref:multicopper oxidase family protein n=1 Tax=Pseudohongiella sp. SYSU M77423 TaxID=3042312 RepID=UPI00247FFDE4|nr:copper oxidase [Pseudohongiella sp. SYSU M77423]MDH7943134.1 copper oxidase [Pseudohongiella sp. SYSU M77423]